MPQDIPATYNGFGKRLSIKHALSCPKGKCGLVWHDDAAKEWGVLGSRALVPFAITYKPKINSRILQGGSTGSGARQDSVTANGEADIVRESQGSSGQSVDKAAI